MPFSTQSLCIHCLSDIRSVLSRDLITWYTISNYVVTRFIAQSYLTNGLPSLRARQPLKLRERRDFNTQYTHNVREYEKVNKYDVIQVVIRRSCHKGFGACVCMCV